MILAFFQRNQRVQDQGTGRTARQGNEGSGEVIVDRTKLCPRLQACGSDVEQLLRERDAIEQEGFDAFLSKSLDRIRLEDKLFSST
jgi:hypothetical protein